MSARVRELLVGIAAVTVAVAAGELIAKVVWWIVLGWQVG